MSFQLKKNKKIIIFSNGSCLKIQSFFDKTLKINKKDFVYFANLLKTITPKLIVGLDLKYKNKFLSKNN
jgi:hypothetical protein